MKLYVVLEYAGADREAIAGIFSTEEKARVCKDSSERYPRIEIYELDRAEEG